MTLQRNESIASSGAGPRLANLPIRTEGLVSDSEQDDLLQTPSLEAGIFGVLFTLSQEKNQHNIQYQWIFLKILLDAWQVFTTIVNVDAGWDINKDSTLWKGVAVLNFGWLNDLGYKWYVTILYAMAGLLAFNLVLCVWVAWSFKEQKFDYVWPIKVVRGFSYVFIQVFDITSLSFLQLGISCNYMGHVGPHLHLQLFPQYSCTHAPHIIHAVVSGILLMLFVAMAMLVNMGEVEVTPTSRAPQALGHSGAEVTAFAIKTLMTLVGVFVGQPKVASALYLVLAIWLAWEYLRWVPHLLAWVNCLKTGTSVAMVAVAGLQLAVVLLPRSAAHTLTMVMAYSIGPMFIVGAIAAWLRTKIFTDAVLKAFSRHHVRSRVDVLNRTHDPEVVKPKDIYHFSHPRDVEVAARSARVWMDLYTLEKTAVRKAEEVIKAGVALYPDNAYVSLVYANFMIDCLGFSQTGARQLETARKLNPSLMCRFMLFVRQQQATQKAASSTVGKGGSMDLLGYVEYQRKQRMVLRHHKDALQAMANFWRILGSSSVSFTSLSKSLEDIDTSVSKAETAYRVVLELYNNSPRLVRLYAKFLETIKQDPWGAAEYNEAAEELEQSKDEDGQGPALPDGTPISRMDDVEKGVVVVNAFGDIQVANKKLHTMFGYKKGELDAKNVMVLMPPHEAKRHPALLRRYIDSGDKAAPYFKHPVLGIHRERVTFTVRIAVSRASGLGEDSVFIGIIEALPTEPGVARIWVTRDGVIVCCDPGFVTCFGYHPDDVIGMQLDKLLRSGNGSDDRLASRDVWAASKANHDNLELVQRMLDTATEYSSFSSTSNQPQSINCRVLHKYDFAKDVTITAQSDLTKTNVYELRMKLLTDEPQLLMVVERKGAIRHMSGDLAKVLGVGLADTASSQQQGRGGGSGGARRESNNAAAANGTTPDRTSSADDQVMMELMAEVPSRSLDDFLPAPWNYMHYKYRKYVKGGSPNLSGLWGCRAALSDNSGSNGPTMRLVGVHGKPVYVHVAVASREEGGDVQHVVRMARSSLETAVDERRVRVRLSDNGTVQEVLQLGASSARTDTSGSSGAGASSELFGFPSDQMVGCRIWDFLAVMASQSGNSTKPPQQPRDVLAEAEAMMASNGSGWDGKKRDTPSMEKKYGDFNLSTLENMITSTLQTPGISWRVSVIPPAAIAEAAAMGSSARASAVLARRTRHAILRLDVVLPPPGSVQSTPGKLAVHAELWAVEAVTGVVELDGAGKITSVLEEEIRPPGLLFGIPQESLNGTPLASLLKLQPGQSPVGLLNESGIAKKSSLKTSSKGKSNTKVGPVHYLEGFHRDGQPLSLAVQVVGRPGSTSALTVVLRLASRPKAPMLAASATAPNAAATHRAHVFLDVADRPAGHEPSAGHHTGFHLKLAQAALTREQSSNLSAAPVPAPNSNASKTSNDSNKTPVISLKPQPGGAPTLKFGHAKSEKTLDKTPLPLPGASSLAAGVANVIKARSFPARADDSKIDAAAEAVVAALDGAEAGETRHSSPVKPESPPVTDPAKRLTASPRMAAALGEEETAAAGAGGQGDSGERSSPQLPELKAEQAVSGDRAAAGDGSAEPKESAPRRGLTFESGSVGGGEVGSLKSGIGAATSVAMGDLGDMKDVEQGLGTVDKWVSTGGKFYQNLTQSVAGSGDLEEADEGDDGSGSPATSSHWASPRASETGGLEAQDTRIQDDESVATGIRPVKGGLERLHLEVTEALPQGTVGVAGLEAANLELGQQDEERGSDGAESAISGISGTSGLSDANTPADFKRGKRYRKLVKLMDSPQAQKVVVYLKINTSLALFCAGAVHILCFALILTAISRQSQGLDELASAGGAQRYLQKALVAVRALDQAYKGKGSNNTYASADIPMFADDLTVSADTYRDVNNDLLHKVAKAQSMFNNELLLVESGYNASTGTFYPQNTTMANLVTLFYSAANDIIQNHAEWNLQGSYISDMRPAAFLLRSGQSLITGASNILDTLLDVATSRTNAVNTLQLLFLLLEGFLVAGTFAIGLVYMLRSASEQRYQLYETFLTIPVGLTRALASQTTHLLDDDESEDEEDEDGQGSQTKDHPDDLTSPAAKRKTLFEDPSPVKNAGGGGGGGNDHFRDHNRGAAGSHGGAGPPPATHGRSHRMSMEYSPLTGFVGGGHTHPGGGGGTLEGTQRKLAQMEESLRALAVGAANNGAGRDDSPLVAYHRPSANGVDTNSVRDPLGSGFQAPRRSGFAGWLAHITSKVWRSNAVQPLPSPTRGEHHRSLERNSKIANKMLAIVATYSLLIILFYSISYAILLRAKDMVAMQSVADQTAERTYRSIFYAQELIAEEDVAVVPTRVQAVRNATVALTNAYFMTRMGAQALDTLGDMFEEFPWVSSHGLASESATMFKLFYGHGSCLRLAEHLPCPPTTYRFYRVTHTGADSMMLRMLEELQSLADEADAAVRVGNSTPGFTSDRWDYIYNVGTMDLNDANLHISSEHLRDIRAVFKVVVVMHVVLFLLIVAVFLSFLLLVYIPLLHRMKKEKRRIAEMMSQLPPELDVMRLVSTALMGPKAAVGHHDHHHHHHMNMRPGPAAAVTMLGGNTPTSTNTGMAPGTASALTGVGAGSNGNSNAASGGSKAYQAWKDILNRASTISNSGANKDANGASGAHSSGTHGAQGAAHGGTHGAAGPPHTLTRHNSIKRSSLKM